MNDYQKLDNANNRKSRPQFDLFAELNEKLAAARSYHQAQAAFMNTVVNEQSKSEIMAGLYDLRVNSSVFYKTPALRQAASDAVTPAEMTATVDLLELMVEIQESEQIIKDWILSATRPDLSEIDLYVDRALEVSADPRHDLFLHSGEFSAEIRAALQERGCSRIIDWTEVSLTTSEGRSEVDIKKMDACLRKIGDLTQCPPQRVWCLWGPETICPIDIRQVLDERLRKSLIDRNTISVLGPSWARNFILNLPALVRNGRNPAALFPSMKGSGVVIVGAGPSLDDGVEWIKSQNGRPVIITAFKSLKALEKHGITPDFVVMLDPNQRLRHLEGVDLSQVAGVFAEVSVCPEVLEKINRPIFPFFAGESTGILADVMGRVNIPVVPTGGSVLHSALQLAKLLGAEEVTFVGADFSLPNNRLYAEGAGTGDVLTISNDGKSYSRSPLDSDERKGVLITRPSNDGFDVSTTLELDAYRLWTEDFIIDWKEKGTCNFYNLSATGARIDGTKFIRATQHCAVGRTAEPFALVERCESLIGSDKISSVLRKNLDKKLLALKKLRRACSKSIAIAGRQERTDLSFYAPVIKRASDCPEVSLMLARNLNDLEQQSRNTTIDVPKRLLELIRDAEGHAKETEALYRRAMTDLFSAEAVR